MILSVIFYVIFASVFSAIIGGGNLIKWLRMMFNFAIIAGLIGLGYLVLMPLLPVILIVLLVVMIFYKVKEFMSKDKEDTYSESEPDLTNLPS